MVGGDQIWYDTNGVGSKTCDEEGSNGTGLVITVCMGVERFCCSFSLSLASIGLQAELTNDSEAPAIETSPESSSG
jgi:hypothetical protein